MSNYIKTENGNVINIAQCIRYTEKTQFDGRNQISVNTGSQWSHEALLFHEKRNIWILNKWSNIEGTQEQYEIITDEEAYEWLLVNDHEDDVPSSFKDQL